MEPCPVSTDGSANPGPRPGVRPGAWPEVRRGQLWRATCLDSPVSRGVHGRALLGDAVSGRTLLGGVVSGRAVLDGVVLDVDPEDGLVWFAPVTADLDCADPFTGIVPAATSPTGTPIAVFAGLTTPIPLTTLERRLGQLPEPAAAALHGLWRDNMRGVAPTGTGLRTGSVDVSVTDPRREYRIALRFAASRLQAAE